MKYKSEICEAMHQDAIADFEVGAISEARMREYDEMCLVQEPKPVRKTEQPAEIERTSHAIA
jgi:DNA-binding transcriptional regulator YiaG